MSRWGTSVERTKAQDKVNAAIAELAAVCALPTEIGAQVRWVNQVVWTRIDDDKWTSSENWIARADRIEYPPYSSAHVASLPWVLVESPQVAGPDA